MFIGLVKEKIFINFLFKKRYPFKVIWDVEEEEIIFILVGTYLFIKFLLILFESFIEKTIKKDKKLNIFFHIMKFIKTFTTMNSFVTIILVKENVKKRDKKIVIMIGIPLLLYLFFLGLNQLILYLRRRSIPAKTNQVMNSSFLQSVQRQRPGSPLITNQQSQKAASPGSIPGNKNQVKKSFFPQSSQKRRPLSYQT